MAYTSISYFYGRLDGGYHELRYCIAFSENDGCAMASLKIED